MIMNRTKLLTIAVIGLLLINLGTLGVLLVQKPGRPPHGPLSPPPHKHGEGPRQLIIDRLHFDAEQQKQYDVLINEHRIKTDELHEASRDIHNELYSLLKADTIDRTKADSLILQIADNQKAVDNLNFSHFQEIKKICKPGQFGDFNELAGELAGLFGPKGPPPPKH